MRGRQRTARRRASVTDTARELAQDVGENHRCELLECDVAFVDLRTHHGAFPSTEQEGCERTGVETGPDRAGTLRLADAGLKRLSPRGENRRQTLAHQPALVSELGAKITNQAALGVTLSG